MASIFNKITEPVPIFQERRLPEEASVVGYAALIKASDLAIPPPVHLSVISSRPKVYEAEDW